MLGLPPVVKAALASATVRVVQKDLNTNYHLYPLPRHGTECSQNPAKNTNSINELDMQNGDLGTLRCNVQKRLVITAFARRLDLSFNISCISIYNSVTLVYQVIYSLRTGSFARELEKREKRRGGGGMGGGEGKGK